MVRIVFTVPVGTMVYFHKKGQGFNINTDFGQKRTAKEVVYDLNDVWFLPPDITVLKREATEINEATPEGWPAALQRAIGFCIPENEHDIDYMVVAWGDIKWHKLADDASKTIRQVNQSDHHHYFPGQIPREW